MAMKVHKDIQIVSICNSEPGVKWYTFKFLFVIIGRWQINRLVVSWLPQNSLCAADKNKRQSAKHTIKPAVSDTWSFFFPLAGPVHYSKLQ